MDLNKIVGALGNSGALGGLAGGVAGGAVTSALMSKKGRKHAKTLLKVGGIAAVGGLAWKAYQNYQQSSRAAPPSDVSAAGAAVPTPLTESRPLVRQDFDVATEIAPDRSSGSRGLLLMRAMIAAAVSDGHMDDGERGRILSRMQTMGLEDAEKALVVDELLHPRNLEDIAAEVNDQATAIEVYAASLLAVDETREEARRYLDALAARLALPPLLIEALAARSDSGQPEAA
jgi:uncharacterized membrane protein YebE (DUF533 family)